MKQFRFEDFEIWKEGMNLLKLMFRLSQSCSKRQQFELADQIRRASISITNNIAEGSGSASAKDFSHFLNISRRSLYECANLVFITHQEGIISEEEKNLLIGKLVILGKKITMFQKSLRC